MVSRVKIGNFSSYIHLIHAQVLTSPFSQQSVPCKNNYLNLPKIYILIQPTKVGVGQDDKNSQIVFGYVVTAVITKLSGVL